MKVRMVKVRTVLLFSGEDAEMRAEKMLEAKRAAKRRARMRYYAKPGVREREIARAQRWKEKNKDRVAENHRRWAKENRERLNLYHRAYYARSPERRAYLAMKQREYDRESA